MCPKCIPQLYSSKSEVPRSFKGLYGCLGVHSLRLAWELQSFLFARNPIVSSQHGSPHRPGHPRYSCTWSLHDPYKMGSVPKIVGSLTHFLRVMETPASLNDMAHVLGKQVAPLACCHQAAGESRRRRKDKAEDPGWRPKPERCLDSIAKSEPN